MIEKKFGIRVKEHIMEMTRIRLKRRILENQTEGGKKCE